MPLVDPVIVVPGITATYLRDDYRLPPEVVWSVLTKDFPRSTLHPDDLRYDMQEPARVRADQVFELAYKELINELRYNLSPAEDQPVPVYPFGYDWRHPLEKIEADLADFIREVIERTSLLRHYAADGYGKARPGKVNLVGHSMGGLIIAGYLDSHGGDKRVKKVASLASPFWGSQEAVLKIAVGTANMGAGDASSREREATRVTPALYHLIPSYDGAVIPPSGLPPDMFDRALWQPEIEQALVSFIRINGLTPANAAIQAPELFAALLAKARTHRRRIERLDLEKAGLTANDWLCVVGVDSETRVQLKVERNAQGAIDFDLSSEARLNQWGDETPARRVNTGDGTVPFLGAIPGFLPLSSLVCIRPDDFAYYEVGDIALSKVAGFHGILPNMDMLQRLVVRHFKGSPDPRKGTWGRPAPNLPTGTAWTPPIPNLAYKP
ncbi:MAG: alpha/beta fold hydrolase [Rhodospirillaceae bacterium]